MDPYSNTQQVTSAGSVGAAPNLAQPAIGTFNVPSDVTQPATEYATNPPGKFAFERKMDEVKQQKDLYGEEVLDKDKETSHKSSWFGSHKDKDTAAVEETAVADDDTTTHKKGFGAKLKEGFKHLKEKIAGHHKHKEGEEDRDSSSPSSPSSPEDNADVDKRHHTQYTTASHAAVGSGIGSGLATTHVSKNSSVDTSHIDMDDSIKKLEDKLATSNISVSGAGTNYMGSGMTSGVDTSSIGVSQLGGPAALATGGVSGLGSSDMGSSSFGSSSFGGSSHIPSSNPVDDKIPSFISNDFVAPTSTTLDDSINFGSGSSTLGSSNLGSSNLGSSSLASDTYPASSSSYSGVGSGLGTSSYMVSDLDNNFGGSNIGGSSTLGGSTLGSSSLGSSSLGSSDIGGSSYSGLGSSHLGSSNLGSSSLGGDTYSGSSTYVGSGIDKSGFGSSNLGSSSLGSDTYSGSSGSGFGSSTLGSSTLAPSDQAVSSYSGASHIGSSDVGSSGYSGSSHIGSSHLGSSSGADIVYPYSSSSSVPSSGYHMGQTNLPSTAAAPNFAQPAIGTFNVASDTVQPATEYTTNPPGKFAFERAADQRKQEMELFGTSPSSSGLASDTKDSSWSSRSHHPASSSTRTDDTYTKDSTEDKGFIEKIKDKLTG